MKNSNVQNKTFINYFYNTWLTYKNLYNSSTNKHYANLCKCVMCDIVYLYSQFTNTDYDVSKRLFNYAYEIGFTSVC